MRYRAFYSLQPCGCEACSARMAQANEIGFALCRDASGRLAFGPQAEGGPFSVDIPVECPPGTSFFGLYHTHPGGDTKPSLTDMASARQFGAKAICIEVPETGEMECYQT